MTATVLAGLLFAGAEAVATMMELDVMKLTTLLAAGAAMFVFAHSAQAQMYHRHPMQQAATQYGGRPAAWCGWEMRQLVGSDPGPAFNLARNWASWGRPGPAGVGAVVVWSHHVGKIVGRENGVWVIQSGNDGQAVRSRPMSIAGAIAIRWG
jgi:hypothetical protein